MGIYVEYFDEPNFFKKLFPRPDVLGDTYVN